MMLSTGLVVYFRLNLARDVLESRVMVIIQKILDGEEAIFCILLCFARLFLELF